MIASNTAARVYITIRGTEVDLWVVGRVVGWVEDMYGLNRLYISAPRTGGGGQLKLKD
jgi:hypothetical protein